MLQLLEDKVDHFAAYALALLYDWEMRGLADQERGRFYIDTKLGRVCARTTCSVTLHGNVFDAVLTPQEARELSHALTRAASVAEEHDRFRRGEKTHRVTIRDGVATLEIERQQFTMRRVVVRKSKHPGAWMKCARCSARFETGAYHWSSYRIDDRGWGPKPRTGEVRLCLACFAACIVDDSPRLERVK